jgi:hypothetical protein
MNNKVFLPLKKLEYEVKIGNKIIADKTIKNILSREIMNREIIREKNKGE